MKTGKGQGPKKKSPACTGPSQPFEFRSCPTISRQPCRAVQSDERNPYRSFYYADETLGGRNGPATIASGIITSKYFSHLTHLTD